MEPEVGSPPVHADLAGIAFLLGTWKGEGVGRYPTIAPFSYGEILQVGHVGKPFLTWAQRTWSLDDERLLHSESGYVRPAPQGKVEMVLAHPLGVVEVQQGRVAGKSIELHSTAMALTQSAKEVTALGRRITVDEGELHYVMTMAAVGHPEQQHLEARLFRQDGESK